MRYAVKKRVQCFALCTGHGDSASKNLPTKVKYLPPVDQVACGSSHTVVVSKDGKTVWSFGSGDAGTFTMSAICHVLP